MNERGQKGLLVGGAAVLVGIAAYLTLKPSAARAAVLPEPYRPPTPGPEPYRQPTPGPESSRVATAYVKAPSGLMLRSGPGTSNPPVMASAMPYGSQVTLLGGSAPGTPGGWAKVSYAGKEGYASTDWLSSVAPGPMAPSAPSAPTPSGPAPSGSIAYVKAPSGLMLRTGPGTSNPPVMPSPMPYGSQVTLTGGAAPGTPGGWAKVIYAGKSGYASTDWLSTPQVASSPPSWQVPVETKPGTETYQGAAQVASNQTYEVKGTEALAGAIGSLDDDPFRGWIDIHG